MGTHSHEHRVFFDIGQELDVLVIDANFPLIATSSLENLIATLVYTSDSSAFLGTIVNGAWKVKEQKHIHRETIVKDFQKVMRELGCR